MANNVDYLSDENGDLIIENGDFKKGDSTEQEVIRVLRLNQGNLTQDPLLGPNLIQLENQRARNEDFRRLASLHLERDGKDFNKIRDFLKLKHGRD